MVKKRERATVLFFVIFAIAQNDTVGADTIRPRYI